MNSYVVVGSSTKVKYELDPGNECPLCGNGVLGWRSDTELVCLSHTEGDGCQTVFTMSWHMTIYVDDEGTEYELDPGDQCPLCMSGTLGDENEDELVCRGECGNILTARKPQSQFYQTEFRITVLSRGPLEDCTMDVDDIHHAISEGECLGRLDIETSTEISSRRCAHQCEWMGSTPEFFQLDEEGNDLDE